MYCDDKNDKVPPGDVWYSWSFWPDEGGPQPAWHEWPHPLHPGQPPSVATNYSAAYPFNCVESGQCSNREEWYHAIGEGLLFQYVKDYKIYRCPVGNKGQLCNVLLRSFDKNVEQSAEGFGRPRFYLH